MGKEIYLDNSATTCPYEEVVEYMYKVAKENYGNPSSLHTKGIEAEKLIRKARKAVSESLGAEEKEIIFTSGGTEANNLAIRGYLEANPRKGKKIITTRIEHPSVLEVYHHLEKQGYQIDYIGVDSQGMLDMEALEASVDAQTALISIILVNNETGAIQPLEEIVTVRNKKNPGTVLHVDAVQAYGKMKIIPARQGIDLLSMSAHKIHGPKGIGALYVRKGIRIKPILLGGGQEASFRSGTENVPGICGFGLATEITFKRMEEAWGRVAGLKQRLMEGLSRQMEEISFNSPKESSPYILNVSFRDLRSEVLLHHLEERDIFVSTGSACSSRKNVHSHVLGAMGLGKTELEGAIRFSFSTFNCEPDIDETIKAIVEIVPRIKIKRGGGR